MAVVFGDSHRMLLNLEYGRICGHLLLLQQEKGIAPEEITLVVVLDLRGNGRVVAVEALGEILVRHYEVEAASTNSIPSVSFPMDGPGGMQLLVLLVPEFVEVAVQRRTGTIPVLLIDHQDEPGITFIHVPDLDARS